jgi:serine/threonine-protein kinase RsbW
MTAVLQQYQLEIISRPENIIKVESFVEEIRKEVYISDDVYGNMLVAVTEAVNNAIMHGNSADRSKSVSIAVERNNNTLSYIIKDQGSGFDHNNLPDPTSPENIEKLSGRGVFLMKQLADLVIFSDRGSTVEIHFKV